VGKVNAEKIKTAEPRTMTALIYIFACCCCPLKVVVIPAVEEIRI
jgi:hypothetical protein